MSPFPSQNHDGSIDFREYVIGLAVLCNPANTEEIIQVAFKVLSAPLSASRAAPQTGADSKCIIWNRWICYAGLIDLQ